MKNLVCLGLFIIFSIFGMTIVSCNIEPEVNYVKIISVTPSENLIDGIEQEFIVIVDWEINTLTLEDASFTADTADLSIYFNTLEVNHWIGFDYIIATKGSGRHTFKVIVNPKNWYPEGKFSVYVRLSPNIKEAPYSGPTWSVSDEKVLLF